jgi:pimeloyl-ACP methyl ester carboxylesterase
MRVYKYLPSVLGVIFALPILALISLAFIVPITISGIGYLLGCSLVISGLIIAPWTRKYYSLLIITGVFAIAFVAGTRLVLAGRNTASTLRMMELPQGKETRWLSYVIDEQDSVIFGEAIFHFIGSSSVREHETITQSLYEDYSDMRHSQGIFPSPFVNTYLNLQQPASFDAIIIEPEINNRTEVGVIFLHGFMGNVTAQCWEIAKAVQQIGAVTVCPSTRWRGKWWRPQGQEIIQATFNYLREQGIQRFYLGGFSNGGFGISRLASQVGKEEGLHGLFFIDGIDDGASIRETGLPVLVIQGAQDERMPATEARRTAEIIGDLGTYVELQGDHFLIMKQPDLVQNVIATWLEDHESYK